MNIQILIFGRHQDNLKQILANKMIHTGLEYIMRSKSDRIISLYTYIDVLAPKAFRLFAEASVVNKTYTCKDVS